MKSYSIICKSRKLAYKPWGISSAGRAPALHAGGQGFESLILHHFYVQNQDGLTPEPKTGALKFNMRLWRNWQTH